MTRALANDFDFHMSPDFAPLQLRNGAKSGDGMVMIRLSPA